MAQIKHLQQRDTLLLQRLLVIWETSVIKTHLFLTKEDIQTIKIDVKTALETVENLYVFYDDKKHIQGFIVIEKQKVEMLFVDANVRGQGIGKQLLLFAIAHFDVRYVDVNEQNQQAVEFYYHMGFQQQSRSESDDQGRPFPILHFVRKLS